MSGPVRVCPPEQGSNFRSQTWKAIRPEHTAPDGTELTILQKVNEVFLYVNLENSFFEMHIHIDSALSEASVDAVADNLNYVNIGK